MFELMSTSGCSSCGAHRHARASIAGVIGCISIVLLALPCSSRSTQETGRDSNARALLGQPAVGATHSSEIGESFGFGSYHAHIDEETGRTLTQALVENGQRDAGDEFWSDAFGLPGVDQAVECAVVYDGDLVIGGSFYYAGDVACSGVARWDGAAWQPLGEGLNDVVLDLAVFNGDLIAAGWFTEAGGSPADYIARWDGGAWHPLGTGMNDWVEALVVFDGDLIAGGLFDDAGGSTAYSVARWNGSSWSPMGSGLYGYDIYTGVYSFTSYDGDLVAGGSFESSGGTPVANIARWGGASWNPLGIGTDETVLSLTVYAGDLIAGGLFWEAGGLECNAIARWDGLDWYPLGTGMDHRVDAIVEHGGYLYAGGPFTDAGGIPVNHFARWDGVDWEEAAGGVTYESSSATKGVAEILPTADGLLVGGYFFRAGDLVARSVALYQTGTWSAFGEIGQGIDNDVEALVFFDGQLVAAGEFLEPGGTAANYIARWDGVSWHPLGGGLDNDVLALAVYDGDLVAGGWFTEADGSPASRIARWDGSSWYPLGAGVNGAVYALTVSNGELIAGGNFTEADGSPASNIASWNGSTWSPIGTGVGGIVRALTLYDGDLIAGGFFASAGGISANNIARWDGGSWSALGTGVNDIVLATLGTASSLVASGMFTEAGGQPAVVLAEWYDGAWHAMGDVFSEHSPAVALVEYEGNVVAGGWFSEYTGAPNALAWWDGANWNGFGSGMNRPVLSLATHDDRLFAGGMFDVAGGKSSVRIAIRDPGHNVYIVNPYGTGDYATIQEAIDAANWGDVIELTDGDFTGNGNRDLDYRGKGVTVRSQSRNAQTCIINCEGSDPDRHRGCYFYQNEPAASVLQGVTITNGYHAGGGAIMFNGASPTITDCIFLSNGSTGDGGAIYCTQMATPTLTNCRFIENNAGDDGGAMQCRDGGSPLLNGCTLHGNTANDAGGAMYCTVGGHATLSSCTIAYNDAPGPGSAMSLREGSSVMINHTLIAFNGAGAAVHCSGSTATLLCCDVYGNAGGDWVGCIAGQYGENNNIALDPRFCDPPSGDLTLGSNSPCTDGNSPCGQQIGAHGEGCDAIYLTHLVQDNGTGDFPTIQAAIDASAEGDTVELADGTFTGDGNRDLDYLGKAIVVRSASDTPENCVINSQIPPEYDHRGFHFHNAEGPLSMLRGVTITGALLEFGDGGGILIDAASPMISNCNIVSNIAGGFGHGGGICCLNGSEPLILDCFVSDNEAGTYQYGGRGGGIYADASSRPHIESCTISDNEGVADHMGSHGGGIDCVGQAEIIGCLITSNTVWGNGAGIHCGAATISDCEISENLSQTGGGGIHATGASISDCMIRGNRCDYDGVGGVSLSNGDIRRCVISGNQGIDHPTVGGLGAYGSTVDSCTVAGNAASISIVGGMSTTGSQVSHTIIWGNCGDTAGSEDVYAYGDATTITCGAVDPSKVSGTVDFVGPQVYEDPLFCDPVPCENAPTAAGNYALTEPSPCAPENNPDCGRIGALPVGCSSTPDIDGLLDPEYGAPEGRDSNTDGNGSEIMDLVDLNVIDDGEAWYFHFSIDGDIETQDWGKYAIYIDTTNDDQGATYDAWLRLVTVEDPHRPEYGIYTWVDGVDPYGPEKVQLWYWEEATSSWRVGESIEDAALAGGRGSAIEWKISKAALGNPETFWCEAWSTGPDVVNAQDTINDPPEDWNAWDWETTAVLVCSTEINETAPSAIDPGESERITRFALLPVYPNPSMANPILRFEMPLSATVELQVFDVSGRLVRTLIDNPQQSGVHHVVWTRKNDRGRRVPSGVYYVRARFGVFEETRSVILLD